MVVENSNKMIVERVKKTNHKNLVLKTNLVMVKTRMATKIVKIVVDLVKMETKIAVVKIPMGLMVKILQKTVSP
ncbi:MAG: hypothetical protein EB079_00165 [Verrucomicrobia bacterium]|nr:hypothetical protein [Verrucomicrobiota bacterium]